MWPKIVGPVARMRASSPEHAPVAVSGSTGCSFRAKRDRSGNVKYKNVPEQKLAYIAKNRMKRQPTMSASEQANNKRYSQSKSDCDIDEMLRAELGGLPTQGAPTSGPGQRKASHGQPLERRTAPSPCAVTWVCYDTSVRRSCCLVPKTCLFTPSSQRRVARSLAAHGHRASPDEQI